MILRWIRIHSNHEWTSTRSYDDINFKWTINTSTFWPMGGGALRPPPCSFLQLKKSSGNPYLIFFTFPNFYCGFPNEKNPKIYV